MNNIMMLFITNTIVRTAYVICVTLAAIAFNNPILLFWYVLVLFLGHSYSSTTKKEDQQP